MDIGVIEKAWQAVQNALPDVAPRVAVILGSGWSTVAEAFECSARLPYSRIPGLGAPGVKGHAGELAVVKCGSAQALFFMGRRHWYEGVGWEPIAIPVYVARQMGVRMLVLTNAAGGIREDLTPGSLMLLEDHINAMGTNPLVGPHSPDWGPRFPDQTRIYSPRLQDIFAATADTLSIQLSRGVYLAATGPTYETPAEIRAYGAVGADAVGMSTVPEAILGNAAGMEVAAVSCITNAAAGISAQPLSHTEVIEETRRTQPRMRDLLDGALRQIMSA